MTSQTETNQRHFTATNDIVVDDIIRFTEAVFTGSYRKAKFAGDREITAIIKKESYGSEKQQHTFTLEVIESTGCQALEVGKVTRRKGRNIYKNGVERLTWSEESTRDNAANEKHMRGNAARSDRKMRLALA